MLGTSVKPHTRHTTPWNLSATVFFHWEYPKAIKCLRFEMSDKTPREPRSSACHRVPSFFVFVMRVWPQVQVWFKRRRECAYVRLSKCTTSHPPLCSPLMSVYCNVSVLSVSVTGPGPGQIWLAPEEDLGVVEVSGGRRVTVCPRGRYLIGGEGVRHRPGALFLGVRGGKRSCQLLSLSAELSVFPSLLFVPCCVFLFLDARLLICSRS